MHDAGAVPADAHQTAATGPAQPSRRAPPPASPPTPRASPFRSLRHAPNAGAYYLIRAPAPHPREAVSAVQSADQIRPPAPPDSGSPVAALRISVIGPAPPRQHNARMQNRMRSDRCAV